MGNDYFKRDGRKVQRLVETSVSRLLTHFNETGFAVLTAYRGERTPEENAAKLGELKGKVRDAGYSFIPIEGRGREQHPDGTETIASEPGVFIPEKPLYKDAPELLGFALQLGRDYDQTSILYKSPTGPVEEVLCATGEVKSTMPRFGVKEWASFWTSIVHGSKSQQGLKVVFESVVYVLGNAENFIEGMGRQAQGEIFNVESFLKTPPGKRGSAVDEAVDSLVKES